MSISNNKILFTSVFYFVICATLIYDLQYIFDIILREELDWNDTNISAAKFAIIGLTSFICTFVFIKWQGISLESLGVNFKLRNIGYCLVFGAILGALGLTITALIEVGGDAIGAEVAKKRDEELLVREIAILAAFQILFVGPGEELIFRGYLQSQVERVYDPYRAMLLSGCAFGLIHVLFFVSINPESVVIIFVSSSLAGIGFAYAKHVSGNLAYPIALHAIWNVLSFALNIEYVWGYDPKAIGIMEFVVESIATLSGIGAIVIITYALSRYTTVFINSEVESISYPVSV